MLPFAIWVCLKKWNAVRRPHYMSPTPLHDPPDSLMALKALCSLLSALCPLISLTSIQKDWYPQWSSAHLFREKPCSSLWKKKHANPLPLNEICALILCYRFEFEVINYWKITCITCVVTLDPGSWITFRVSNHVLSIVMDVSCASVANWCREEEWRKFMLEARTQYQNSEEPAFVLEDVEVSLSRLNWRPEFESRVCDVEWSEVSY